MRRRRDRHGLPPELAATDHLGKQLERKRRAEAAATRLLRATQAPLEFHPRAPDAPPAHAGAPLTPEEWFAAQGWRAFAFQRAVWEHMAAGRSGLLHASTGTGKTYAVWFGALDAAATPGAAGRPLTVLWITPMRALAADTVRALQAPLPALGIGWTVAARTGDTAAAEKSRQADTPPTVLVTTPESLTLMLARADAHAAFRHLRAVIVDEWHELVGSKRGVQTQLALARLARWRPDLLVWGLSATLGNLDTARAALFGARAAAAVTVRGEEPKETVVDTLLPASMERFPWGGHLGLKLLPEVVAEIERHATTLVFTNVRSQAEIWYQALLGARPDWAGVIALHHGSLDREIRAWVEAGLKQGTLKAVVCTSSLDLGVDFLPVERVLQIGSPKGIARLLQRAGRAGHAPGRVSRATIVPTNALELIEAQAAREAAAARRIEARQPPAKPHDVLVQHLVTIALGGGFAADALYDEVRGAYSYRDLTRDEFDRALGFVTDGGALAAYPDYRRIAADADGIHRVSSAAIARRHRMSVGTIVADATMHVAWVGGGRLGTIEESFIARLRRGDAFTFGGRVLELVRVQDMTAYVRKAARSKGVVPQWAGARMSFSSELADASLAVLGAMQAGRFEAPEARAVRALIDLQRRWSALPGPDTLVVEAIRSAEGHHLFVYPFAGRMAHIGLASLFAWRAARDAPGTFSISMNDYGFELVSPRAFDWAALIGAGLFDEARLTEDVLDSLNASELAQRRFREIARIAGLVFQGFPGAPKSTRQVQASSGLFYEVFRRHDAGNLLLAQAEAEALEQELEIGRLRSALAAMRARRLAFTRPARLTPFAFPLMVERLREAVSTESLADRVQRLLAELEAAAGAA
ncbi:MAG: ligase-associated DNA damage response DEXH box helicase [Burkholderiales bacterium]|nr:ligase-associated DNA damage response DEXH box helicase [Burkholderiales bacterium]